MGMFKVSGLAAAIVFFGLTANVSVANASWDEAMAAFAKKEYAAAAKLFRPLAEKGNALAQYRIAMMHKMGWGLTKDQKEAKKWSRLAAKQGNADAQLLLGSLYYKADGDESPDIVRAYIWYDVSAEQGSAEAKKEIASISKEMNPQQIADAQERAKKCKSSKYEQCD
jgi:TPR repeat protein